MKMKRKSSIGYGVVIAVICIVIYLFALAQGLFRFFSSIDNYRITAEQEFSRISELALSAGMHGFMDEQFIDTMNNALAASRNIEALIITGPDGEYAFERQQGHAITWVNNSPRFINRFGFSGQSYYRPLPIQDLRNANIQAVAGAFDYTEISGILKETLIIIMIGFALAFFTMLFQLLLRNSSGKTTADTPVTQQPFTDETFTDDLLSDDDKRSPLRPAEGKFTPLEINPRPFAEKDPKGLYSPRSNIGWEEYTFDRLDSELHRCASTENDLTLVLIEFTEITNDIIFKQAAEEAVSTFSSRDLLFEYGKTGILIILPGIDLEAGISKSEKFYQRIIEKYSNGKSKADLCIGLSSRSGRLLSAGRLMLESREALEKAKADPASPIIAFKSDPEKYRAFVRKQE